MLVAGKLHHAAFTVDGRANVATMVVDGILCDGGRERIQGWWRLNPFLGDINGEGCGMVGEGLRGRVLRLRVYDRYLRTSEAIANYGAGAP